MLTMTIERLTRSSRALMAATIPSTPALVDTSPCTLPSVRSL